MSEQEWDGPTMKASFAEAPVSAPDSEDDVEYDRILEEGEYGVIPTELISHPLFPVRWSSWKPSKPLYRSVALGRPLLETTGPVPKLSWLHPLAGSIAVGPMRVRESKLEIWGDQERARVRFFWRVLNKTRHRSSHSIEASLSFFYNDSGHEPIKELQTFGLDAMGVTNQHEARDTVRSYNHLYAMSFFFVLLSRSDVTGAIQFKVQRYR
jgi:hypothetical protein